MNRLFGQLPKACVARLSSSRRAPSSRLHLSQASNEDQWLWPLSNFACKYVKDHSVGTRISMVSWTLEASRPIEPHHWNQAFLHVLRMCPVMQVKIKKREGHLWYCYDDNVDTRCEILHPGSNLMKVVMRKSFTWYGRNSEVTSLFGFVVIPEAQEDPGAPLQRSATHPHRYTLVPIFHHAIFDGVTVMNVLHTFLETLNEVIDGKFVDDSAQRGIFVSNEEIKKIGEDMLASMGQNTIPEEKNKKELVILKGFPPPGGKTPTTKFIFKSIDMADVAIMKEACKREGVTFHTAVMNAYQTAVVELLQESGVQEDKFIFCVNMTTDLHRYMAKRTLPIYGLHAGLDKMFIEVNITHRCGFWDLSRNIERKKKDHLSSQEPLRQMVAQTLAAENSHPSNEPSLPIFDYSIAGIRELVKVDSSNTVQVKGCVAYSFVHDSFVMSNLNFYISKGTYLLTYNYSSDLMTEKTASLVMDKTFHVLRDKCQS